MDRPSPLHPRVFWRIALALSFLGLCLFPGCEKAPIQENQPTPVVTPTPVSPPVSTPTPHKDSEDYPISAIAESKPLFTPPSTDPKINQAAWNLICDAEVGTTSEAYYMTHKIRFPEWPEGQSGVTWGIGYDAGYNTKDSILRTWKQISEVERLALCAGVKGARAKTMWTTVDDILIPWSVAVEVFNETTIPRFYQEMCRAFPGAKELKLDAQGALTSMVYNRGGSLIGDSRIDLRTIAKAVPNKDYKTIAEALRHMNVTMGPKWRSQGEYAGLSKRREAEARMVEGCIK